MGDMIHARSPMNQVRRRTWNYNSHFSSDCHVSLTELDQETTSIHGRSVHYVPTVEHLTQSMRNEAESQAIEPTTTTGTIRRNSHPRITRMLHNLDQQTRQARRTSIVLLEPATDTQMPPLSSSIMSTLEEDCARQARMLRHKHDYNSRDNLRLAHEAERLERTLRGASPSALYVFSRQIGHLTETCECHGFCYNIPVNVRISAYPIDDQDHKSPRNLRLFSPRHIQYAFRKETLLDLWSRFCISSHSAIYFCPTVPFHRMLNIRLDEVLVTADSGDLLLEGSFMSDKQQYIQYKSTSLTAQVAVIYRCPETGVLYVLTSRKWPRSSYQGPGQSGLHDLLTVHQKIGVQMCSLEAYLQSQRSMGIYYIYRRLSKKRRSPTQQERVNIGQQLYQWYVAHQEFGHPSATELRFRLKELNNLRAGRNMTKRGLKILESRHYTSSQTAMNALVASGVLCDAHTPSQLCFSAPGYFEMKNIRMASNTGSLVWNYEVMSVVSGIEQSRSTNASNLIESSYVRMVDEGLV